MTKEKKM